MNLFKKILCPLDFSDASREALRYAKNFAETFDSELVLMHVSPNVAEAYTALMPDFPNFGAAREEDIVEQLNEFTGDWAGRFKKVIRVGTPYLEILEYADVEKFDLIILGAKGLSKFERLFLGVTGEKVTRKAHCPVLTVHAKPAGLPIKRILLPVDFSHLSYAVLPIVAALAEQYQAEINVLHVVELGHQLDPKTQTREYDFFEKLKLKLEEQWELPRAFEKIETKKFIRHHIGSAGYGIMEFAQDWDIDLIAMATHGRTGLSKVVMGSVTEKVIKISPCPVLSVRSETSR
jgi:nucleotide-binding universal stress UspA family protein